jgi:hypothetical protein
MDINKEIIIEMELKLLDKNIRNNKSELKKYISKEFIEYGVSGKIYSYDDTLNLLSNEEEQIKYKILAMDAKILSDNIILVLYIIEMNKENEIIITNRSSIWKKENNDWKIIFHQGTKSAKGA